MPSDSSPPVPASSPPARREVVLARGSTVPQRTVPLAEVLGMGGRGADRAAEPSLRESVGRHRRSLVGGSVVAALLVAGVLGATLLPKDAAEQTALPLWLPDATTDGRDATSTAALGRSLSELPQVAAGTSTGKQGAPAAGSPGISTSAATGDSTGAGNTSAPSSTAPAPTAALTTAGRATAAPTPVPTSAAATTAAPTTAVAPSPAPSPAPTAAPTVTPTTAPISVVTSAATTDGVISGVGGALRVRCTGSEVRLLSTVAVPGFQYDVKEAGPSQVRVELWTSSWRTRLEGRCENGVLRAEVSDQAR